MSNQETLSETAVDAEILKRIKPEDIQVPEVDEHAWAVIPTDDSGMRAAELLVRVIQMKNDAFRTEDGRPDRPGMWAPASLKELGEAIGSMRPDGMTDEDWQAHVEARDDDGRTEENALNSVRLDNRGLLECLNRLVRTGYITISLNFPQRESESGQATAHFSVTPKLIALWEAEGKVTAQEESPPARIDSVREQIVATMTKTD